MLVEFELSGQKFSGLNGGPQHTFNEAVSIVVPCADQAEVDYYWSSGPGDSGDVRHDQVGHRRTRAGLRRRLNRTRSDR
jgi:predicted 3-demethylubiquinone-9 3-methyltransferase (glyoxalase superfamily)